jgi:hypothetical protein
MERTGQQGQNWKGKNRKAKTAADRAERTGLQETIQKGNDRKGQDIKDRLERI